MPVAARPKSRRSLDALPLDNPDVQALVKLGIPACLFPADGTQSLGALWRALHDRFELQQLEIQVRDTKLDRERHPLSWVWVKEREDLLKTYTGLNRDEAGRDSVGCRAQHSAHQDFRAPWIVLQSSGPESTSRRCDALCVRVHQRVLGPRRAVAADRGGL